MTADLLAAQLDRYVCVVRDLAGWTLGLLFYIAAGGKVRMGNNFNLSQGKNRST